MNDMMQDMEKVLLTREQIAQRVQELAKQISADYQGKELTLVGVLKGAVVLYAELALHIDIPVTFDFMAISSYGQSSQSSGVVRILKDLERDIEGKHVLIVEDIIDTGLSLKYITENMHARGPASVKICALLDKPSRRKAAIEADYVGFAIPDAFVVGYGLDYGQKYRNLPYIGILKPQVYS